MKYFFIIISVLFTLITLFLLTAYIKFKMTTDEDRSEEVGQMFSSGGLSSNIDFYQKLYELNKLNLYTGFIFQEMNNSKKLAYAASYGDIFALEAYAHINPESYMVRKIAADAGGAFSAFMYASYLYRNYRDTAFMYYLKSAENGFKYSYYVLINDDNFEPDCVFFREGYNKFGLDIFSGLFDGKRKARLDNIRNKCGILPEGTVYKLLKTIGTDEAFYHMAVIMANNGDKRGYFVLKNIAETTDEKLKSNINHCLWRLTGTELYKEQALKSGYILPSEEQIFKYADNKTIFTNMIATCR